MVRSVVVSVSAGVGWLQLQTLPETGDDRRSGSIARLHHTPGGRFGGRLIHSSNTAPGDTTRRAVSDQAEEGALARN